MKKRTLGKNGIEVSALGLGCMSMSALYGPPADKQEMIKLIRSAIKAAHDSFRGIGYHKARALFGKDIWDLFEKLSASYSFLIAFGGVSVRDNPQYKNLPDKIAEHLTFVIDTCSNLPDHFKPYVYFGDYSRKV